jgi:negative regulator of sigma E activity
MTTADLTEQLRAARPVAPETLRERVRGIAASGAAPAERSRFQLPRLPRLRLALPAVAATAIAAAALIAVVRPGHQTTNLEAAKPPSTARSADLYHSATPAQTKAADSPQTQVQRAGAGVAPTPTTGRAQDYQAQIGLEVKDDDALSSATKRALTIVRNLGGYVVSA